HTPPSSGISFEKVFDKVAKRLIEEEKVMVVALDDINYLFYENEVSKVLYSILRAHEAHPGVKVGLIGILSDLDLRYSLDPRVNSVFLPDEINFPIYSRSEIYDIMKNRANRGFYPNVISEEVLVSVVDKVERSGDLRVGIDLLRRSGLNAERRASKTISIEDVEKAFEKSGLIHLSYSIRSLKSEEKVLLRLVAESGKVQAGDAFKKFREETGLSYTTFHEMVNKLDAVRLIDVDFTGEGKRGRSRLLSLRFDAKEVLKVL
ncbi:MAG: ORC1-type DNA replication protein, partial [Halobacteriota archaeon]|nr:ORC1-type DNA replication protein [Halobacteriota archaeon]